MTVIRSMGWWRGVWHAPDTPATTPWTTCRRCGLARADRRHDRESATLVDAHFIELDLLGENL